MFSGPLPERVNHKKLATEKRKLEGVLPLAHFERLAESLQSNEGEVTVKVDFRKARKHATKVVGKAEVTLVMECQNCLKPVSYDVKIQMRHTIVNSDEALFNLDEDEDGLVNVDDMIRTVDIFEDELILALPMVPRHTLDNSPGGSGDCQVEDYQVETLPPIEQEETFETHKPFAGLAELKDTLTSGTTGASNGRSKK